jgi:hypothetical protein
MEDEARDILRTALAQEPLPTENEGFDAPYLHFRSALIPRPSLDSVIEPSQERSRFRIQCVADGASQSG